MRSTARKATTPLRIWLVFLLATVPAAGVAVGGSGPCFSVSVTDSVVLPDGSVHDAGVVRICVSHELSPVTAVHKVYVDREHVAMLVSKVGQGEALGDGNPVVMFNRDSRGRLHLAGFAAPEDGRMTNYLLHRAGFRRVGKVAPPLKQKIAQTADAGTVLIAARDSNGR